MDDIQPPRGAMPVLQFCLPAQLHIDPLYQRMTDAKPSRTLINKITRQWDWGLYQPLVVAQRPGGKLYVIDGQHRLEAARQRGDIAQLPCVVTDYTDAREEATAFVSLNQERRPLSKLNVFRAALAADDADAVVIDSLIQAAGLRLTGAADSRRWKVGWINNIVAIQQCQRQHGEKVTRIALEALAGGFAGQVLRYCGTLFGMIVPVVAQHSDTLPTALLIDLLRDRDAEGWMTAVRGRASADGIGTQLAARALLKAAVEEALEQ